MAMWIVFITVLHAEQTSKTALRSERTRSEATYPLLAAPSRAVAELVIARLTHLRSLAHETPTDARHKLWYKEDSVLTPQEVALVQDLSDPGFPEVGRHPAWLTTMLAAAKIAIADAGRQQVATGQPDTSAYLFVGSGADLTPSTVFYRASSVLAAESLRRLLTKAYSATGSPAFNVQAAEVLPPEDCLLLDEAIDELAMYDDPDPGVYDAPSPKDALVRAEYARRADRWEAMQARKASAGKGVSSVAHCMNDLLHAVERHRLMFLYWAAASRRNPLAVRSRTGIHERVTRDDVRGWKEMVETIDADGVFLWTNRDVLDRYAQESIGMFGPGEGTRPHELDAGGRSVAVEGGSFPYWLLDDGCMSYLENSSDAVLNAARLLAEAGRGEPVREVVRQAMSAARPSGHDRWQASVVVPWSYLAILESLIARLKTVRVEVAMPADTTAEGSTSSTCVAPDPQEVANLVVLLMVLRDVCTIREQYPDAIPDAERQTWMEQLTSSVHTILDLPGFEFALNLLKAPGLLTEDPASMCGTLMAVVLTWHPLAAKHDGTPEQLSLAIDTAMQTCQKSASAPIQEHVRRLADVMVIACRSPTGTSCKDFSDPRRSLQMFHRYWAMATSLVLTQLNVKIGYSPHPLLHMIENLRDRLCACFAKLQTLESVAEAREGCDMLLGHLTEGAFEDLSEAEDMVHARLQLIERFVARGRIKLGPRTYPLTSAEAFFLGVLEPLIAQHATRVKEDWKRLLASNRPAEKSSHGTSQSPSPSDTAQERQRPTPTIPSVVLGHPGTSVVVNGKQKCPLTDGGHAVVAALIEAGAAGMSKDAIEAVRRSARRILGDLREDPDWAAVIIMPGRTNGRYRVRI